MEYCNEWDNLQLQVQKFTKIHKTNGWEIFISHEMIIDASNSPKNIVGCKHNQMN